MILIVMYSKKAVFDVECWAGHWNLPLNAEKTTVLTIGKVNHDRVYQLGHTRLSKVQNVRDLGYFFSKDLSFTEHYKMLVKKALFRTYNIFKALKTKDPKVLIKAYKTYVRSVVENGTTVFNPYKRKDIEFLESVQNNFTRKLVMRTCSSNYSSIPNWRSRNEQLGLEPLYRRRIKNDLIMAFKILTGKVDLKRAELFQLVSSRTRSGKIRFQDTRVRTKIRSEFFSKRVIPRFRNYLKDGVLSMSLNMFKSYLGKRLQQIQE